MASCGHRYAFQLFGKWGECLWVFPECSLCALCFYLGVLCFYLSVLWVLSVGSIMAHYHYEINIACKQCYHSGYCDNYLFPKPMCVCQQNIFFVEQQQKIKRLELMVGFWAPMPEHFQGLSQKRFLWVRLDCESLPFDSKWTRTLHFWFYISQDFTLLRMKKKRGAPLIVIRFGDAIRLLRCESQLVT